MAARESLTAIDGTGERPGAGGSTPSGSTIPVTKEQAVVPRPPSTASRMSWAEARLEKARLKAQIKQAKVQARVEIAKVKSRERSRFAASWSYGRPPDPEQDPNILSTWSYTLRSLTLARRRIAGAARRGGTGGWLVAFYLAGLGWATDAAGDLLRVLPGLPRSAADGAERGLGEDLGPASRATPRDAPGQSWPRGVVRALKIASWWQAKLSGTRSPACSPASAASRSGSSEPATRQSSCARSGSPPRRFCGPVPGVELEDDVGPQSLPDVGVLDRRFPLHRPVAGRPDGRDPAKQSACRPRLPAPDEHEPDGSSSRTSATCSSSTAARRCATWSTSWRSSASAGPTASSTRGSPGSPAPPAGYSRRQPDREPSRRPVRRRRRRARTPTIRARLTGFYWTEGLRGLGWAHDAVPTLKGGSTIGIPSRPASGSGTPRSADSSSCRRSRTPRRSRASIAAGRRRGRAGQRRARVEARRQRRDRWRDRVARPKLASPGDYDPTEATPLAATDRWPAAAWGGRGGAGSRTCRCGPSRRVHHLSDC